MTRENKIKLARNISLIAIIFCSVVALLLLLNFWQISRSDPIESKVMTALVERLNEDPDNEELKNEIRNFDLLARKAYFTSRWQVRTGAYLLLFGGIVLGVALRSYYALRAKIDEPEKDDVNEIATLILARKGILFAGGLIFVLALAASFLTVDYLDFYDSSLAGEANGEKIADEHIEVIDIRRSSDRKASDETLPPGESEPIESAGKEEMSGIIADDMNLSESVRQDSQLTSDQDNRQKESVVSKPSPSGAGLTLEDIRKNHNSFRGPLGQGIIYHKNIPVEWNGETGNNILWKSPVPKAGLNSPVIWQDKVFLAGADNESLEVYCYNSENGKLLWTGTAENIPGSPSAMPKVTEDTGLSAPTVTTDGKRVYAIFATGDVIAFTIEGERVWAKNLGVPDNHYGHSSSLITWDNKLFIQYDTNKGGRVMALNGETGETVWETVRNANISWASPVLAETEGSYQLLLTADPIVSGYDIKTGKELWSVDCMMGEVGASVGFSEGIVYAANEYATLAAIDVKKKEIMWENNMYLPEASSPLAHNGLLIIATSYGVLVCYDAMTGEQYWEHDVGSTLYSSPLTADGKLFMMDNEGIMRVYEFAKELKLISENKLGETAGTTPAFAEGRIYIRTDSNLYCIGE